MKKILIVRKDQTIERREMWGAELVIEDNIDYLQIMKSRGGKYGRKFNTVDIEDGGDEIVITLKNE